MPSGVYRIWCLANGRQYIGSACNLKKRWQSHWNELRRNRHKAHWMQRCWNKYEEDSFLFEILLYCERKDLLWYEQRAIDVYHPEFNSTPVTGSMLGFKHSTETRLKMAMAAKRTRNFTGHRHTEESKRRMADAMCGRKYGPQSLERRAKIGAALRGRVITPEWRAKISKKLTGTSTGRGRLTVDQVREIRRLRTTFGWGRSRIAKVLGITPSAAISVIGKHAYGWVT